MGTEMPQGERRGPEALSTPCAQKPWSKGLNGLFIPRAFLPEIGVVSRLLKNASDYNRLVHLVAPYRAILRYCRCDTPYRARYSFREVSTSPKMVRYPLRALSLTQVHLCDAPFCKHITRSLRDTPQKQANVISYYRYKYCVIRKVSLLGL